MDEARWRSIERLYHMVLERPEAERAAFLDQACSGDAAVRREVALLLAQARSHEAVASQTPAVVVSNIPTVPDTLTGRRFGVYELRERIGAGGMGEVYRALDTRLRRDVAVKILPATFTSDRDRVQRFAREARLLASLNHPNIATVHGLEDMPPDESGGRPTAALVMELVEGETVADRIARGPVPVGEAIGIARQVADGVAAAHDRGVVHRDLKPANLKIRPDGTLKVLDFGLARAAVALPADRPTQAPTVTLDATGEGVIVGTVAYMSPEQARGQVVDKRTDIWSFGCVLYEMLTGRPPFRGLTVADTLARILERDPEWTALPRATTPGLRRLIRGCLQKDPRRRIRDIGDAIVILDDDGPDSGSSAVDLPRRGRWLRNVALVGGGAIAAAAITTAGAPWLAAGPEDTSTVATIATQLTDYGGTETSPAISPDGRTFVFVSDHGGTPDIWVRQIVGGEPVRLTNDATIESDLAYSPDGDSIYFTRAEGTGRSIWRIGSLGGHAQKVLDGAQMPVPSPDGRRLASYVVNAGVGMTLQVNDLDGGAIRRIATDLIGGVLAHRASWSPDGQWISFSRGGLFTPVNLFVADSATGQTRQVTRFTRANEGGGAHTWMPDSRHMVVSYVPMARQLAPSDLGILDVDTGQLRRLTISATRNISDLSLSADGRRLIARANEVRREVWRVPFGADPDENGRTAARVSDVGPDPMWTFASRDGSFLLYNSPQSGSRNLWLLPLAAGGRPRQVTALPGDSISHSSLSPDGRVVAFASVASGNSCIWTQGVDGTDLKQLTDCAGVDAWPVWSPDGRWIIFNSVRDGSNQTWRIPSSGGAAEKLFDGLFRGDWSERPGGGNWVVASYGGSGIRLFDPDTRSILWEDRFAEAGLPMFSADGGAISMPFLEERGRDSIRVYESASGASRTVARLPFRVSFRASWTEQDKAFLVNRVDDVSHIVLFDRFWTTSEQ